MKPDCKSCDFLSHECVECGCLFDDFVDSLAHAGEESGTQTEGEENER